MRRTIAARRPPRVQLIEVAPKRRASTPSTTLHNLGAAFETQIAHYGPGGASADRTLLLPHAAAGRLLRRHRQQPTLCPQPLTRSNKTPSGALAINRPGAGRNRLNVYTTPAGATENCNVGGAGMKRQVPNAWVCITPCHG